MATHNEIVTWFKRWRKPIRQWLSHRENIKAADLDDLAQEVFVRLLRYSDDVAIDNPQGYLFRIAANVANEWEERARNRKLHDADLLDELIAESTEEPEVIKEEEDEAQFITDAVMKLPPRQQEVLLLSVASGMTYKQIAVYKKISNRVVLRDLTRAYATLRISLSPVEENRHSKRSGRWGKHAPRHHV